MNNVNGMQVQYSVAELTKLLEPELVRLVQGLKSNMIPSAIQCEKLCSLLAKYAEAVKATSFKPLQKDVVKRVCFTDYMGDARADKDKGLLQNEDAVNMLCKIGLEKLMSTGDVGIDPALLGQLAQAKLVTSISDEGSQKTDDYFALTTKGWNWLKSKEFQKKAQNSLPVFPAQLGVEPNMWNELTFHRAKLIHAYYREYPAAHGYITFAFPHNKQFLFGCDISETNEVAYVCPYVFKEVPSEEDVDILCEVIGASELKILNIVSTNTIGLNNIPVKIKNTVAAVAANIAFFKLGD